MKKYLLITFSILFLLSGCKNKNDVVEKNDEVKKNEISYLNLNDYLVEEITKEEYQNRVISKNVTCGVDGIKDENYNLIECSNSEYSNYSAYIEEGTPFFMTSTLTCEDEDCNEDDVKYKVYKFNNVSNILAINSNVNQDIGIQFVVIKNNRELYYFSSLVNKVYEDDKDYDFEVIKMNLDSDFSSFSNFQTNDGTITLLSLKNLKKYVILYDKDKRDISLREYDKYLIDIKKGDFLNTVKYLYRTAEQEFILYSFQNSGDVLFSSDKNKLNIIGRDININYCIKLDGAGNVKILKVSNGTYSYRDTNIGNPEKITIDNVKANEEYKKVNGEKDCK